MKTCHRAGFPSSGSVPLGPYPPLGLTKRVCSVLCYTLEFGTRFTGTTGCLPAADDPSLDTPISTALGLDVPPAETLGRRGALLPSRHLPDSDISLEPIQLLLQCLPEGHQRVLWGQLGRKARHGEGRARIQMMPLLPSQRKALCWEAGAGLVLILAPPWSSCVTLGAHSAFLKFSFSLCYVMSTLQDFWGRDRHDG